MVEPRVRIGPTAEGPRQRTPILLVLLAVLLPGPARAANFLVNGAGDQADSGINGICSIGPPTNACTLRAAIQEANANGFAVTDNITFGIGAGPQTITVNAVLPSITTPVSIDGTTQPGWVLAPIIQVSGSAVLPANTNGLTLTGANSSNSTIRGLVINGFDGTGSAIRLLASSANNVIIGNYLGTNAAGTAPSPNGVGVFIQTSGNRVGGPLATDRNIISGNTTDGTQITGGTATNNLVQNNYIGLDVNGTADLGNSSQGVAIFGGADTNTVDGNVISGNNNDGVLIGNAGTTGNIVQGNRIGTDAAGTVALGNLRGIEIAAGASGNTIGGAGAARNLISGNLDNGVLINASNTNTVQGNFIGTDVSGTLDVGNGQHGVQALGGSSSNVIGGAAGLGNVISGNSQNGVDVIGAGTSSNRVIGNIVGLDTTGDVDLGNTMVGVAVGQGATANIVGEAGNRNVISGNDQHGVRIVDAGTNNNLVQNNIIGLDITGALARPNGGDGVRLEAGGAATGNVIGGNGGGVRNVISANGGAGVNLRDFVSATLVAGNYIGLDVTGTLDLGNTSHGVLIASGSSGNTIGGALGVGNVISGNGLGPGVQGVRIDGLGTNNNEVARNFIGTDAAGTAPVGNSSGGIAITNSAANNTIGGAAPGAGNRIAFNAAYGVNVSTNAGTGNAILGNRIYGNTLGNSFGLGIDLQTDGVTANDLDDADPGANELQNFPVLSAATTNGASVHIAGSLAGALPLAVYRVEFFASTTADPSGFGEGERFLGSANVTTDGNGDGVIGATFLSPVAAGELVSATATDPANNTSEFAASIAAVGDLVVTTTADAADAPDTSSVTALITNNGPDGRISLREAILATNATAGAQTIRFGIPLADPGHLYYRDDLGGGLTNVQATPLADTASLSSPAITDFDPDYPAGLTRSWYRIRPTSALPDVTGPVVLDAETQPGFVPRGPVVELDGSLAGAVTGLSLMTGPGTVKGLVINRFGNDGLALRGAVSGYTITGNYIGTDASGTLAAGNTDAGVFIGEIGGAATTIGGDTAAERNLISGNGVRGLYLWAFGAPGITSQIRIQGNYIGTDVTGTVGLGVQVRGMTLEFTGGHVIGGPGAGEGNVISGNNGFGIELNGNALGSGTGADNNLIEGNRIGTNAAGTAAVPNASHGVIMFGTLDAGSQANGNTVRGNVIAAAAGGGEGIRVAGRSINNVYESNFIGTDSGATLDLGNSGNGIEIEALPGFLPTGNIIRGNTIRFNDEDGVSILADGANATLIQNAIWSNDGLGIDLGGDGVTSNDPGDADPGPNDLLNFPLITSAFESGGTLTVNFRLDAGPGTYRIEMFKNPAGADPSTFGEGQVFVNGANVNHPGGNLFYVQTFPGAPGDVVTATATCTNPPTCGAFSTTSEFSKAMAAVTTAVELVSFTAVGRDGAVDLAWQTASELGNLGFHLYRSASAAGPYDRITTALIPGLGSSPMGTSYRYRDPGLTNGVPYFYKLEDVDTTGRTELHGPISAAPAPGEDDDEAPPDPTTPDPQRTAYGDPEDVSLRILERSDRHALLELRTGGFYATPNEDGSVDLFIPSFEDAARPGQPNVPIRRAWVEAVAGRRVQVTSVRAEDVVSFPALRPAPAGSPQVAVSREGVVRPGLARRSESASFHRGPFPRTAASLRGTAFQGETKKAELELAPLRFVPASASLALSRRLLVRVDFLGKESGETPLGGSRGRRLPSPRVRSPQGSTVQLVVQDEGLYRARFEEAFPNRRAAVSLSSLSLSRQGEPVAFFVDRVSFGPGASLYFLSAGASLNPDAREAVYLLEVRSGGRRMATASAAPTGALTSFYWERLVQERNKTYQAGLLDAPELWLWEALVSPVVKTYPFTVDRLAATSAPARLTVWLQGGSDFPADPDHHVRVSVNGTSVGEASWDGAAPRTIEAAVTPGLLVEGANTLRIENVGDTAAASSMVLLDRFALEYPRTVAATGSVLRGSFSESGVVEVAGLGADAILLDTTLEAPRWLTDAVSGPGSLVFRAEADHRYFIAGPAAVKTPTFRFPARRTLTNPRNQADYLLVGPRELLPAAPPLLALREGQGLRTKAVALEDVFDAFGFGEASPHALKRFLAFAYHSWQRPSPRYVVLLGDATYDPKDHLKTGVQNRIPPLITRTTYLWTASDPSYAALNGEDLLPDLALGRLPAQTLEEARLLVGKVVTFETAGRDLSGPAVIVADNPDQAGDFERNAREIAATDLAGRDVQTIFLSEKGAATRAEVAHALDQGASLLSYVGHGSIAVWASENVWNNLDVNTLAPQAQQPVLFTMNCLNGFFHFPPLNSLAEQFVKADGRGAIAAFSPSGLSLDGPAHVLHRAILAEIVSGRHARLGDAVLAAQGAYADSGAFPELLSIYHLFGDPALQLR